MLSRGNDIEFSSRVPLQAPYGQRRDMQKSISCARDALSFTLVVGYKITRYPCCIRPYWPYLD